jgi:hypothetical protein
MPQNLSQDIYGDRDHGGTVWLPDLHSLNKAVDISIRSSLPEPKKNSDFVSSLDLEAETPTTNTNTKHGGHWQNPHPPAASHQIRYPAINLMVSLVNP